MVWGPSSSNDTQRIFNSHIVVALWPHIRNEITDLLAREDIKIPVHHFIPPRHDWEVELFKLLRIGKK